MFFNFHNAKNLFINTFQKEYRNKGLIFSIILTIIVIYGINSIVDSFFDNLVQSSTTMQFGETKLQVLYVIINFWIYVLSALLGSGVIKSDYDHNVIIQILSLPISKTEYLLIRILASWSLLVLYYIFSIVLGLILFSTTSSGTWAIEARIPLAMLSSSLGILFMLSLGVMLSLYLSKLQSFIGSLIMSLIIIFANDSFFDQGLGYFNQIDGVWSFFKVVIHTFIPRLGVITHVSNSIFFSKPFAVNLWIESLFLIITIPLFFFFIVWKFSRLECSKSD